MAPAGGGFGGARAIKSLFQLACYIVLFPGAFSSATVLAINLLGDSLSNALDPRLAQRI